MRGSRQEVQRFTRRTLVLCLLAGVLGWGLAGSFYALSIQYAGPAKAAIIGASAPLFAVPLSWLFLGERPTRYTVVGTALTIAGVLLVV